jgi:hypothetical protein
MEEELKLKATNLHEDVRGVADDFKPENQDIRTGVGRFHYFHPTPIAITIRVTFLGLVLRRRGVLRAGSFVVAATSLQ